MFLFCSFSYGNQSGAGLSSNTKYCPETQSIVLKHNVLAEMVGCFLRARAPPFFARRLPLEKIPPPLNKAGTEGYAAGKMKHHHIALLDEKVPVIVIAPHDGLYEKTVSNMRKVMACGSKVLTLSVCW
jgi:hypothetical protein